VAGGGEVSVEASVTEQLYEEGLGVDARLAEQ
jgi:hypothetical protein